MKRIIHFVALCVSCIFSLSACLKPSIELDDTVWGDKAVITAAVLFRYDEVTNELGYGQPVTGYQNVAVTTTVNKVDATTATVSIVASKGTDLKKIGIRFSHFAKKIEPIGDAPPAGLISDFSKGNYVYRLYSADGTIRDWKVDISVAQ